MSCKCPQYNDFIAKGIAEQERRDREKLFARFREEAAAELRQRRQLHPIGA